ncbi:MAG: site-specific integrase, partial [Salinisphaera sp.]|nr:site-specific integrase [Salinisphaera sp.]
MDRPQRELIDAFCDHLRSERGLSPHSLRAYRRDLCAVADGLPVTSWAAVDWHHLRQLVAQRHRRGAAPASLARLLSGLRSLYAWLEREGHVSANPAQGLRAPRRKHKLPATLDPDEIQRLLDTPAQQPLQLRDRAIMELFYSSGLRLAELVGLNCSALDLTAGCLRVTGKGRKQRQLPVGRKAVAALRAWLAVRGQWVQGDEP